MKTQVCFLLFFAAIFLADHRVCGEENARHLLGESDQGIWSGNPNRLQDAVIDEPWGGRNANHLRREFVKGIPNEESEIWGGGSAVARTWINPDPLCSFTIEIYPESLRFGDPLYVRLRYENNSDTDAYVCPTPLSTSSVESVVSAYYLRTNEVVIPWVIRSGFHAFAFGPHIWQKVKPGERGPTHYRASLTVRWDSKV